MLWTEAETLKREHHSSRSASFPALVVFLAISCLGCQAKTAQSDVGTQMISYTKQGRYDEAIQAGLRSIKNDPNDELTYEGIATVYFVHAQKEPAQRNG